MRISTILVTAALAVLGGMQAKAQMSAYDYNRPVGWATVDGTVTGSNDANSVTVTTRSELSSALSGTAARTIYISGEIEFTGVLSRSGVRNKTIYGLPGSALVNSTHSTTKSRSGILRLSNCDNIIIRNVTFRASGAYDMDGNDNLELQGCTNVWVDHCDFQDGVDGNFDCNTGSDNIAVTWCRFRYLIEPWAGGSGGSDDHRYSDLWGGSDSETESKGKLNTTFYACWWDEGCRERMPRVRFGKVHILNCLYTCEGNNYCVGGGYLSNVYIDRSAFIDVKNPWKNYADKSGYKDYNVTAEGNIGYSDRQAKSGSNEYFIPTDYYTLDGMPVDLVESEVSRYAGATLAVVEGGGVTSGINGVEASGAETLSTEYYSASGMRLNGPQKGLNIVRQRMSDGTVKTVKVIVD